MAANFSAPAEANTTDPVGPPTKGYAVQYERLLMEERSLKKSREDFLKPGEGAGVSRTNDADELQKLKIRGMVHRSALEGMLIAAQHAADICKTDTNADCERGLECTEAKNALTSLWRIKSRQLEEDDNQIPLHIGSECLVARKKFSSGVGGWVGLSGSNQPAGLEASADDFFSAFPECSRSDNATSDSEVDESDNDEIDGICNQKPIAKKKRETKKSAYNDEPIMVTCTSSSPSPDRTNGGMVNEPHATTRSKNQKQPHHIHQMQDLNNSSTRHDPKRNLNETNTANYPTNPYSQRQQNNPLSGEHTNNPYHRKQRCPQPNQWHRDHRHNPIQNSSSAFDYNENISHHKNDQSQPTVKNNPFRTAKELGTNFDDKPREGDIAGNHGGAEDWDNYENGDSYSGNNTHRRQTGVGMNNKSSSLASGRPQAMVRSAIRGPKGNMSAGLQNQYRNPMKSEGGGGGGQSTGNNSKKNSNLANRQAGGGNTSGGRDVNNDEELPEELSGCDKELVEKINNEIVDSGQKVTFNDIAGLDNAKKTVYELVILPMKRPDLFTGLRARPKGMLLFGPPGTGKTMIGKAIAHESGATFFSISSSSLTSKWIGEGEKLVKTLFAVAHYRAPSVVFIDEVDSLLTQRKADENEASRRIKTEFLVQLDGAGNEAQGQVLVIGATNLPHELDDAARRRFVKKLYIPLPDRPGRESLIRNLLAKNEHSLKEKQIIKLSHDTDGFSGADLQSLCHDAAMKPISELGLHAEKIPSGDLPRISNKNFRQALRGMRPSVAPSDLEVYIKWNETYGNKACADDDTYESDTGSDDESS